MLSIFQITCATALPCWRHAPTNLPTHWSRELGMSIRIWQRSTVRLSRAAAVPLFSLFWERGICRLWLPRWTRFGGTSWTWGGCPRSSPAEYRACSLSPSSAAPRPRLVTQPMSPAPAWSLSISRSTQSNFPWAPAPTHWRISISEFSARCWAVCFIGAAGGGAWVSLRRNWNCGWLCFASWAGFWGGAAVRDWWSLCRRVSPTTTS